MQKKNLKKNQRIEKGFHFVKLRDFNIEPAFLTGFS